jgi:hypothetical protein
MGGIKCMGAQEIIIIITTEIDILSSVLVPFYPVNYCILDTGCKKMLVEYLGYKAIRNFLISQERL